MTLTVILLFYFQAGDFVDPRSHSRDESASQECRNVNS